MTTEFNRIKRAVEKEKMKRVEGEVKLESLKNEEKRVFAELEELTEKKFSSPDEIQSFLDDLRSQIERKIEEMKNVLDEEGVDY